MVLIQFVLHKETGFVGEKMVGTAKNVDCSSATFIFFIGFQSTKTIQEKQ